jgi:hypothetical protein
MNDQVHTARQQLDTIITRIVDDIPKFLGALLVLIISYWVAKALAATVRRALNMARLDDRLHAGQGGNVLSRAVPSPTALAGSITYWIVYLFGISIAVSVLGIPVLVDIVRGVYAYIPNVLAAIAIFLVASTISAGLATLVANTMGDTPTGKIVASAGPIVVMGLAVFMILNQLEIAPAIVTITYAALVGSAALGAALAFGLGGRDVAARMLENAYTASQNYKPVVKADVRKGATTAKRKFGNR